MGHASKCPEIPVYDAFPYLMKNRSIGHKNIDLLVVNCEGCEYGFFESIIKGGMLKQFRKIIFSRHSLNKTEAFQRIHQFVPRYCRIAQALCKTHKPTFMYPWIWEGWERRSL